MTAYTQNCSRSITEQPVGFYDFLAEILCQWMKNQRLGFQLARERRQLREMSDSMLADIGIDRAAAEAESMRRDIPAVRR